MSNFFLQFSFVDSLTKLCLLGSYRSSKGGSVFIAHVGSLVASGYPLSNGPHREPHELMVLPANSPIKIRRPHRGEQAVRVPPAFPPVPPTFGFRWSRGHPPL